MAALTETGEEPRTRASSSEGAQQQGMRGTETPRNGDSNMHITDYTTMSRVPGVTSRRDGRSRAPSRRTARGMFGGHDISLYVGKYEKANKILNISGTIS